MGVYDGRAVDLAPSPSRLAVALAACAVVGWLAYASGALSPHSRADEREEPEPVAEPVADLCAASLATLLCERSVGAGFFVREGLLLTSAHVLCPEGEGLRVVLADGREEAGQVVVRDDWLDIAAVRLPTLRAPPLALGDPGRLQIGDTVVALGAPLLELSARAGLVRAPLRNHLGIAYVQFKIAVGPGDSGGPLLDARGRAVGLVSIAARDARGTGLALPITYALELVPELSAERAAFDEEPWRVALAQVAEADLRERESFARAFELPGLAQARLEPGGIEVLVLARGREAPSPTLLSLIVRRGSRTLCQVLSRVDAFEPFSAVAADQLSDSRLLRWLRRSDLGADLYLGRVRLPKDCRPRSRLAGIEVLLERGDPRADRVDLR